MPKKELPLINQSYFATCARGIEPVLADELRTIGANDIKPGRGGVHFSGDKKTLYQANLWLRTAIRVLKQIETAPVTTADELYDVVYSIDWSAYLTPEHTIAVDCNVRDSGITHSRYAALRTKDAICDQFVERCGRRPNVDVERPMVGLNVHIYRDDAVISLDSSGDSLHKRGYRPVLTKAPINEALAAALVLMTKWKTDTPFIDPMCGGGTLPIEAAWSALHRPPGLTRKHFGFMGWMDYDVELWTSLRDGARHGVLKKLPAPVIGYDARRDATSFAQTNARAAGIGHVLHFEVKPLHEFQAPPATGTILCNPPYGERIGEEKELIGLYKQMGQVFRERCRGWNVFVFTGNAKLAEEIGMEPAEEVALFNGKIPCRLLKFQP